MKKILIIFALSFVSSAIFAQNKRPMNKDNWQHHDSIHKHHHDSLQRAEWKREHDYQKRNNANFLATHPNFYAEQKAKQGIKK